MTGAKIEYHTKVVFTLKSLTDASSISISVSNIQESSVSSIIYPILKAVGQVGVSLGDFLPNTSTSSVTLKNGHGSIGHERRFSDLLERYTLINQQVLIYVAASAVGSFSSSDYELRWAGVAKRIRGRGDELLIDIAGRGIQDRVINTLVTSERFPNAPSASLGYALPVIFGQNVQVKPVLTDSSSASSIEWKYGTNLVDYRCAGLQTSYAKAYDGEYVEVDDAGSVSTPLYGEDYVAGVSPYGTSTPFYEFEYAHRFTAGSAGHVITGASMWVNKLAGAADGYIDLQIMVDDLYQNGSSANWGRVPGTVLGRGRYELSVLSTTAGNYEIRVNFETPVVIKPFQSWFFYYKKSAETTSKMQYLFNGATSGSASRFYKSTSLWLESTTSDEVFWCLWGLQIYDTPITGVSTHAGITTAQKNDLTEKPDISKIDWIFEVNGLKDDTSGTVTGSASQLIESAQHAVELMTKQFNGTIYTGGQFGTEHSSTWSQVNTAGSTFYRKIAGKTTGQTKLSQILEQLCRASAARITMHPSASTPMGFWAWGNQASVVDDINQDECKILGLEILGTESVINAVEMFYAEKLTGLDYVTGTALGEFKNYSARINSGDTTQTYYDYMDRISSISRSVFGTNYLENRTQQWIGDSDSAINLALSLLIRFGLPSVYYDIELPYLRFKALKLLDVVRITHPGMAAFFGTTPKASKAVYATDGVEVDLSTGFHWARANSSRFQIEALATVFDSENTPRIRASVRQLNNPHDPT